MMLTNLVRSPADELAFAMRQARIGYAVQPVVSTNDSSDLLYGECLARLLNGVGRVHGPASLVEQLERTGAIADLDYCMVKLVLGGLVGAADSLGCNISSATVQNAEDWRRLHLLLEDMPHLASRLVIEITETCPIENIAAFTDHLKEMRSLGCRVAVDDFGVGAFSPALLLGIEVDIVKIDAAMIRNVRANHGGMTTLGHIVGFASCIAPVVVVEGVETSEQMDAVKASGATHVQGYYIAPPGAPRFMCRTERVH